VKSNAVIAVIGAADCDDGVMALAEAVGREVARRDALLVCGGRGGVMEGACRGAHAAGGMTVGILPGTDREEANPYVDVPVVTGLGEARNAIVVRSADAVVAVSGGYGTLSEIGLALKMGRPVVGLRTWALCREGRRIDGIVEAQDAVEAVALAVQMAGVAPPPGTHDSP
jgi:hypothetical protein